MKGVYSYNWLQSFFKKDLPDIESLKDGLEKHFSEIEGVVEKDGDYIIEIEILPTRSLDCLSHYGIAKEISVIFNLPIERKLLQEKYQFLNNGDFNISIDTDKCDRYSMLKIQIGDIPSYEKQLESIGQKSINKIVDLGNYILNDIGQPTHIFDASKVSGNFSVREAKDTEEIKILGGDNIKLTEGDIVICDNDKPICIAGIIGGEEVKVDDNTNEVFVEIATFSSIQIRKTMRRINIFSDSALRFSQKIKKEIIDWNTKDIINYFNNSKVLSDKQAINGKLRNQFTLGLSVNDINKYLGNEYKTKEVIDVFERLGFKPKLIENSKEVFINELKSHIDKPYKFGSSISVDAPNNFDCSSFIAYCSVIAGKIMPRITINQFFSSKRIEESEVEPGDLIFFSNKGEGASKLYTETIFEKGFPISKNTGEDIKDGINHAGVILENEEMIHAAGSSRFNKVEIIKYKDFPMYKDQILSYRRIFEKNEERISITVPPERSDISYKVDLIEEFFRINGVDKVKSIPPQKNEEQTTQKELIYQMYILNKLKDKGYSEVITYSLVNKGDLCTVKPIASDKGCLRTNIKDKMLEVAELNKKNKDLLAIDKVKLVEFGSVFKDKKETLNIAIYGDIKEVSELLNIELEGKDFIEMEFSKLIEKMPKIEKLEDIKTSKNIYKPFSKYPFVVRDISLWVPENKEGVIEKTKELINSADISSIVNINLFDKFEKDGKLSIAFKIIFQSDHQTLTDELVNGYMVRVNNILEKENYTIR